MYQKDIEAWEKMSGVKIARDIIPRTGRWARRAKVGPWKAIDAASGFGDVTVAPWVRARAMWPFAAATTVEIHNVPPVVEGQLTPLHTRYLSMDSTSMHCGIPKLWLKLRARLHRWEFMLVVAPLRVPQRHRQPREPSLFSSFLRLDNDNYQQGV